MHEQIKGDAKAMLRKRLQKTTSGGPVQEKGKGQGRKGGAGKGAPAASLHDSLKNVRATADLCYSHLRRLVQMLSVQVLVRRS